MNIEFLEKTIVDSIRKRLERKTLRELSQETKISYSHINHIKNGHRNALGISVENLLKLFPNAEISLDGPPRGTPASVSTNSAIEEEFLKFFQSLSESDKARAMLMIAGNFKPERKSLAG